MKRQLFILLLTFNILFITATGQVLDPPYTYALFETNGRTPTALVTPREADILWSKRIYRIIDLREKINHPLYYPLMPTQGRISLSSLLLYGLYNRLFTAYDPIYEDFRNEINENDLRMLFVQTDTINATRPYPPYDTFDTIVSNYLDPASIIQFRIKEDWFFDKERSVLDVRIIGICPVVESFDAQGDFRGYKPLFWLYYPHIRPLLASVNVFVRFNNAQIPSFDDIFIKRIFGSYIYKESNVYERRISEYTEGIDALIEGENIKNGIFEFEHDLWEY